LTWTSDKNARKEIGQLLLVLLVAFAVRLFLARFETEVGVDSVHYILTGDNIAHGRGFDTWNTTGGRWVLPPTFPLLVALFRLLGAGLEWSGHLAAVTAGTFVLVPLYFLTKRLFSAQTALIAILLAAFTPILIDYSVVILTENLFAAFVLAMMLLAARAFSEKGTTWDSFWSGVLAGLAFLTKTFGIIMVPFLVLGFFLSKGGRSRVGPLRQGVPALVGFLLLAIPYWLALHQYTGRWVIDGKGEGQQARVFAADLPEEHIDPRYTGELTADGTDFAINLNPSGTVRSWGSPTGLLSNYVKRYLQKLVRIYQDFPCTPTYPDNVLLLYLFPTILLGLGLFSGPGRWRERTADRFLLYWICPFVFGLPLIFIEVRYFIPLVPLLVPFMARGIEEVGHWVLARFSGGRGLFSSPRLEPAIALVVAVFILLALPKLLYKVTSWKDPFVSYNPRKAAAEWLSASGYHPRRIMEYAHSVSFYSGAQSILIPDGELEDVIRIARKYGADLLSLDEFYVLRAHRRPKIEYLFDTDEPAPRPLERIYVDDLYPGLRHIIYRIRSSQEPAEIPAAR